MDERLKLNDEQNALIDELENLIKRMEDAKIGFLQDDMGTYKFFNESDVEETTWLDNGVYDTTFKVEDCREVHIGGIFLTQEDTEMTVMFKD